MYYVVHLFFVLLIDLNIYSFYSVKLLYRYPVVGDNLSMHKGLLDIRHNNIG